MVGKNTVEVKAMLQFQKYGRQNVKNYHYYK